jgi:hypothetical protein
VRRVQRQWERHTDRVAMKGLNNADLMVEGKHRHHGGAEIA